MPFLPTSEYRARIGGVIYHNVAQPIMYRGRSLVTLTRNDEDGRLAVTLDLRATNGTAIASVVNNQVSVLGEGYFLVSRPNRTALLERATGRVWFEVKTIPMFDNCELECSCVLLMPEGYAVLLHPDRTKCGIANDNQPPNVSRLTLTTDPGKGATAIAINGSVYLRALAIEHFRVGISIEDPAHASA